jgi:hypothetical protein
MEPRNRNVLIILVVVLIIACCCALTAGAGAVGWFTSRYGQVEPFDLGGLYRERIERTLEVGDAPALDVSNFAGEITVRSGQNGILHVVAIKRASTRNLFERIEVNVAERDGRVVIRADVADRPVNLGSTSVALEITAPAGASLDLDTGAGVVDVRGITGPIDARSGAGTMDVRDASGPLDLNMGAGNITYVGTPIGDCSFTAGVGNITLRAPADLNVEVDLDTGIGAIAVDFAVDGHVSVRKVRGIIGNGNEGTIYAHTGAGNILLDRR